MINKTTVKYIQSLQHKKFRDEHNQFFAEGPKVVLELLQQGNFECGVIYCTESWADENAKSLSPKQFEKVKVIKDFELEKISALSIANQVLAVFDKKTAKKDIELTNKLTLVLEDVQDPGNLGTIIRIADWFGVANIICTSATADCYNPKVVQSTMASLGRVNILYTDVLAFLKENDTVKKYAAVLGGKNIRSVGKLNEGIILLGNESKGLSKELIALSNEQITIERIGEAESLNVAVATGIILYSLS